MNPDEIADPDEDMLEQLRHASFTDAELVPDLGTPTSRCVIPGCQEPGHAEKEPTGTEAEIIEAAKAAAAMLGPRWSVEAVIEPASPIQDTVEGWWVDTVEGWWVTLHTPRGDAARFALRSYAALRAAFVELGLFDG